MGVSLRSSASLGTFAGHTQHVCSVAEGSAPLPGVEEVSRSWQRSAIKHGVDPMDNEAPRILTSGGLEHLREPLDKLIFGAQEDIDQLYKVVREAGYVVLFCDSSGGAVEHRGEDAQSRAFEHWGTWLGGVWSEDVEGAYAVGFSDQGHLARHFRGLLGTTPRDFRRSQR
jgi:transcriptional regulator of acetoin/glycerol metabolism